MNLDYLEGISLFSEILHMVKDEVRGGQEVIVCSSFIHLAHIAGQAKSVNNIHVGAQNLAREEKGAFTGEVSALQIKSTGTSHVIIGHSERRAIFNEDNKMLSEKVDIALAHDLVPIFCIGESKEEREGGRFWEVLKSQLTEGIFHLSEADFLKTIIAYEPVWAIGTGLTASPDQAQEVHEFIREEIANRYSREIANSISILYGGSCNPQNAAELFAQKDIDGGLIGGASLKSRDFLKIVNTYNV